MPSQSLSLSGLYGRVASLSNNLSILPNISKAEAVTEGDMRLDKSLS